jgi:hypothetical protein
MWNAGRRCAGMYQVGWGQWSAGGGLNGRERILTLSV